MLDNYISCRSSGVEHVLGKDDSEPFFIERTIDKSIGYYYHEYRDGSVSVPVLSTDVAVDSGVVRGRIIEGEDYNPIQVKIVRARKLYCSEQA